MNFKELSESKYFRSILLVLGASTFTLLVFQAGLEMGYRRASFSYQGGEKYYQAFGPRQNKGSAREFPAPHGAAGRIVSTSLPTFVIEDREGFEKIVRLDKDTIVRRLRNEVKASDIKTDDFAIVIGAPNDKAEIVAKLVRLLPPPKEATTSTQI